MKCPECHMGYAEDSSDDRHMHRIFHDEIINGIPTRLLKSDKIIWRQDKYRIIVVNAYSSKAQRKRAERVSTAANQEMNYDFSIYSEYERPDEREIHLFLFITSNRTVGLSVLEKRTGICHYSWEEYDRQVQKELKEKEPIWSLIFTWVHKKHRRRDIARTLLTKATRYLDVSVDDVGVYTPFSDDGEAFVRSIFRKGFLIAK